MKARSIGSKKSRRSRAQARGSSTLEILIAFAVLTLSLTAVILVFFSNQSVSVDTQINSEALYRAQALLEQARAASRQDFSSVVSQASSIDQSGPILYTKKLDVTDIDSYTKQATSTVFWQTGGRTLSIIFSTLLTDFTNALGGDTCNQTLTGDWTHPQLLGSADIGQNNVGTDVSVLSGKAYVTADSASLGKGDFYIVDVSNPNAPSLPVLNSGGLNTGPGLAAVAVAGRYAYVADISTVSQLQVINVDSSDPSYLTFTSFRVPGTIGTAVGKSIFYANKKVYLGLTKTPTSVGAAYEFNVIDVSTPTSPVFLGGYKTNTQVNAIVVKNNVAYVATPEPTPATPQKENLSILNVSSPASITRIHTFTSPDPSTMDGKSVYLSRDGNTLYLGRTEGGSNNAKNPEFFVLDVSNPGAGVTAQKTKYIGSTVNAVTIRSGYAFMATGDPNLGFQIWDLNSLGSATPYGWVNVQQASAGGLYCDGNFVYIAQRNTQALQIIGPGP